MKIAMNKKKIENIDDVIAAIEQGQVRANQTRY